MGQKKHIWKLGLMTKNFMCEKCRKIVKVIRTDKNIKKWLCDKCFKEEKKKLSTVEF